MSKRLLTGVALMLASGTFALTTMAAQGRGQGGPPAGVGGGGAGAHSNLGIPGGQKPSSSGAPTGHGTTHGAAATPLGPKSPVDLLQQNSKLAANLASLFPPGTDLTQAASGFKNLGQFVSAVHVSHNLGIPFNDLKCAELGTTAASASGTVCSPAVTNEKGTNLGKAIQTLKPTADSQEAIHDANRETEADLKTGKPEGKS